MAYTCHLLDVNTTTQYDTWRSEYGKLLWLAGIGTTSSADAAPAFNTGESPRSSPAASPTGVCPKELKMLALTRPLVVTVPPPLPAEELAFYHAYVQRYRLNEELEKQYIAFLFQEYKKRKSIETKYDAAVAETYAQLETARQRELPPAVRRAAEDIGEEEAEARGLIETVAYGKFVAWVEETIPQWLGAVREKEDARHRQAAAKKAAMDAAKAALAAELAAGNKLPSAFSPSGGDGRIGSSSAAGGHRDPYDATDYGVEIDIDAEPNSPGVSESVLRQRAIKMLEQEEAAVKLRRAQHLEQLRAEEEALRRRVEEKERQKQAASQTAHDQNLQTMYAAVLSQEAALKSRIEARDGAERQKEEERAMLLEHVAAEEQLLRRRLDEKEAKRKAAEEEEKRILYEHIRAEEALLRERVEKKEAAAAEAKRQEEAVREMQRQQEEALQRAKAERQRQEAEKKQKEKAEQLAYLQAQEQAYKDRLRAKELAEIEAREHARQEQMQRELQHYHRGPLHAYPAPTNWGPPPGAVSTSADPARYGYPYGAPHAHPVAPAYPPPPSLSAAHYGAVSPPVYYTTGTSAGQVPVPGPGHATLQHSPFPPAVAYQPPLPQPGYYYS